MRTVRRRSSITVAAMLGAAVLALLAAAAPVAAKEGLEARFDAPIARGTPPGTEILVGMRVSVPVDGKDHPVEGSPIYLRLTGPGGESTLAMGRQGDKIGHYTMRIAVPAGGIADIEVGISGTTDLPIAIVGEPLVAGGITPSTAQVAPAIKPAPTFAPPVAGAPAVGAAASTVPVAAVPVASDVPSADSAPVPAGLLPAIAVAVGVLLVAALVAARRTRIGSRAAASRRAPGA